MQKADHKETELISPYLERPVFPLAVALPRMLAAIEAELPNAQPDERSRLQKRAELIRALLSANALDTQRSAEAGLRSPA
jgi:hypothetical protein